MKPIIIVQGAQYGSEAKGAIAAYLCETRPVDYAVRTGAINAGHTVYYKGQEYKMQQLPTGWVNPETKLVLGPGAMIHSDTLIRELDWVSAAMPELSVLDRLYVDFRAGIHLSEHVDRATEANRHHLIGATGKGCSEALVDRVRRRGDPEYQLFKDTTVGKTIGFRMCDTSRILYEAYRDGQQVLLEGTQGSHLDLLLGPYPYTTHKPCNAAQWVVEAGLPPGLAYEVILVARTYPIRVAGNSGPMPSEISWYDLGISVNRRLQTAGLPSLVKPQSLEAFKEACIRVAEYLKAPNWRVHEWDDRTRLEHRIAASELHRDALGTMSSPEVADLKKLFEMTTVTKKLRRVAKFDYETIRQAIRWNAPSSIALTFANYWFPELWGRAADQSTTDEPFGGALEDLDVRISSIEKSLEVPVSMVSFGPESRHIVERACSPISS